MKIIMARSFIGASWSFFLLVLVLTVTIILKPMHVHADLVLSEHILRLALSSAELSSILKGEQPQADNNNEGFDVLEYAPGKAIVARKNGYCFASYWGNNPTWTDWDAQDFGREKICSAGNYHYQHDDDDDDDDDGSGGGANATPRSQTAGGGAGVSGGGNNCCSTRIGFAKAYNSTYREPTENAIRQCVHGCPNPDECLVLSGHSEGGAIAAIAALVMIDLNPYIITFGQPSTIDAPCPMISGERLFRFVNTNVSSEYGVTYDPVPFIQGLAANDDFGYMIFLGEDSTRVASLGLEDHTADFRPNVPFGLQAHSMLTKYHAIPGYLGRLRNLFDSVTEFPVRTDGFADGSVCSDSLECCSGQCCPPDQKDKQNGDNNFTVCVPKACSFNYHCYKSEVCTNDGLCVPKRQSCMACERHSECSSGRCLSGLCTGTSGLLDNNCNCKTDTNCESHRCRYGMCEARLPTGAICASSEDCSSGICGFIDTSLEGRTAGESPRCEDLGTLGVTALDFRKDASSFFSRRCRISWRGLVVVMICCMVITFTIVKGCLCLRRKDYSSIPSVETYSYV